MNHELSKREKQAILRLGKAGVPSATIATAFGLTTMQVAGYKAVASRRKN